MSAPSTAPINHIHVLYDDDKQKSSLVSALTSSSFVGQLSYTPHSTFPTSTANPTHATSTFQPAIYYQQLKTPTLGRILMYSERVTSTQTILNEQLTHAPVGTVLLADHQVSGKGRGTNTWESPAGCLMFSFKFTTSNATLLPFIQYLVSLEMVRTISPHVDIRIKWPNDLYTPEGVKLGGILSQSSYMDRVFDIVCGIGINVSNAHPTTCLNSLYQLKHGSSNDIPFSRETILAQFMNHLERDLEKFEKQGFTPFREEYLKYWLHTNQRVTIAADNRTVIITGLAPSGFLQACDIHDPTKHMELHPDGNSLDFLQGLIIQKEWKAESVKTADKHACDSCQ